MKDLFTANLCFRVIPPDELAELYWDWDNDRPATAKTVMGLPDKEIRMSFESEDPYIANNVLEGFYTLGCEGDELVVGLGATWQELFENASKILVRIAAAVESAARR